MNRKEMKKEKKDMKHSGILQCRRWMAAAALCITTLLAGCGGGQNLTAAQAEQSSNAPQTEQSDQSVYARGTESETEAVQETESAQQQQKEQQKADSNYAALSGKRISFLTSQSKYYSEYQEMADYILENYGCDVEFQIVPDNEYPSFLRLKLMTAQTPDIFEYNCPIQNAEIDVQEYCEDLSQESWVSRLVNREAVEDPTNGKLYALPKESMSGIMAVYYNKGVLEACGINDPHPKTYEEFLEILDQIRRKGKGCVPFYETNGDNWTTQIFMTEGFPVSLGEENEEVFAALSEGSLKWQRVPQFQEVLEEYLELIRQGYVNNDHLSAKYESMIEEVGTGGAAMALTTEQAAAKICAEYPETEMGAFAIPFLDQDMLAVSKSIQGLFVPKSGEQVEITKLFLELWSQPEVQNIYFRSQREAPAFADTEADNVLSCVQELEENYIQTGKYCRQMNDQLAEYAPAVQNMWPQYVQMVSWRITPQEVLRQFQQEMDAYRKEQGK